MKNQILICAKMALDKGALNRFKDADGMLHVSNSKITKAGVNPYFGHEIPDPDGTLNLDPEKIYHLLRSPEALKKAAPTFAGKPIMRKHIESTAAEPNKSDMVGAIGSNVIFADDALIPDMLSFWDGQAIRWIETGTMRELSCGYYYRAVMEPGEYNGQHYDGRMEDIVGNHLAMVEVGRAGRDVIVADHNPFVMKDSNMKRSKLGHALAVALSAAFPKLAMDSMPASLNQAQRKTFDRKSVAAQLMALDAEINPQQLDNIIDAIIGVEDNTEPVQLGAGDASPHEQVKNMLAGKVDQTVIDSILQLIPNGAEDADMGEGEQGVIAGEPVTTAAQRKESAASGEIKQAHDAALLTKQILAAVTAKFEAEQAVKPVVGVVSGLDSAEAVYSFALKKMAVDCDGVSGLQALRALFNAAYKPAPANKPKTANDAEIKIPGIDRFTDLG